MKVRMKTCLVGDGFVVNAGELHECDAAEAKRFFEADLAEPEKSGAGTREKSTAGAPETAEGRKGGKKSTAGAPETD